MRYCYRSDGNLSRQKPSLVTNIMDLVAHIFLGNDFCLLGALLGLFPEVCHF